MDERIFSGLSVAFVIALISISIYFRSRAARAHPEAARETRSGPVFLVVRLVFVIGLFGFIVAYALNPASLAWASMPIPDAVRALAGMVILVLLLCAVWLFRHLGTNVTPTSRTRRGHELVTTGPYRWVRHPLYTVGTLFWIAMALLAAKWVLLVLVAALIPFLMIRTPREEQNLIEEFGDNYRNYMARTGRYLPRIFPPSRPSEE